MSRRIFARSSPNGRRDEPPFFPCPKKFTFWDTTLLPRGTFSVRVSAGPLADAPRPFSSCSPPAPRRKMRDRALVVAQHSTAFHCNNPGLRVGFGFDPFQNTDDVLQDLVRRVVPELVHEVFRVRTNHRNRFQVLLQRQKVSFIF